MHSEQPFNIRIIRVLGFLFSYAIFTGVLFFVLRFFGKLPESATVFHVSTVTAAVVGLGAVFKRVLV